MTDANEDSALETELRRLAARLDPVPLELVQGAIDAFSWRDIDTELAELVFDSLLDADQATLVRGPAERRMVSFKTAELTVDLEVTVAGTGRDVLGQISPPRAATVEIRQRGRTVIADADELGRFGSASLRAGPMSMRVTAAVSGRPPVVTDWLSI